MLPDVAESVQPPSSTGRHWRGRGGSLAGDPSGGSDEPTPPPAGGGPSERLPWFPVCLPSDGHTGDSRLRTSPSEYMSAGGPNRRFSPRFAGILLRPWERHYLRGLLSQAGRCETGQAAVARALALPGHVRGELLRFRPRCCSRGCPRCDQERRERQAARCEGPWRLFLTLGVPRDRWTCREAWMQFSGWVVSLMARIRDYARRGRGGDVRVCYPFRARHEGLQLQADGFRRPPSLIRYAWVVEPHKSGWPHLHAVLSCDYIDQAWLKRVWGEIVGSQIRWCKLRKVHDAAGVCRYLSKYLSKTQLPLDILAAMGRNRMWACTLPARFSPGSGWRPIHPDSTDSVFSSMYDPDGSPHLHGWRVDHCKPGKYILAHVELSYDQVARHLPDDWALHCEIPSPFSTQGQTPPELLACAHGLMGLDLSTGAPLADRQNVPEREPSASPFGARFGAIASGGRRRRGRSLALRRFIRAARRGALASGQ